MKSTATLLLGLVLAVLGMLTARGDDSTLSDNPYAAIKARNAFNLAPPPATDPADAAPYAGPAAKITPNGLMTLFGVPQVLFKVATPVGPGQPPQVQSYVMSEGDQADGISVTRIDPSAHLITFDNHGTVQTIPLADAGVSGSSAPDSPAAAVNPAREQAAPVQVAQQGAPQQGAPTTDGGDAAASTPADSRVNPAVSGTDSALNDPNRLTPEAQVVLIEAQRQRLQQEGDPTAALMPPTEMTPTASGADQGLAVGSTPPPPTP